VAAWSSGGPAWLPFSPVTAEFQGTSAVPRTASPLPRTPRTAATSRTALRPFIDVPFIAAPSSRTLIAEILELALFALLDPLPALPGCILANAGRRGLEILLDPQSGDGIPEDGHATRHQLAVSLSELSQAWSAPRGQPSGFPLRAGIRFADPSAAGDCYAPGWCGRCTYCRSPSGRTGMIVASTRTTIPGLIASLNSAASSSGQETGCDVSEHSIPCPRM